jgi:beta-aspartyl-dipeptidase (metallo-type)
MPKVASRTWTSARARCRRLRPTPQKLLRLTHKGSLAAGNDADLVVLDESHRADTVVVRGEIHVMDRTCVRRGTFE